MMIQAYKGYSFCAQQQKALEQCRSKPSGIATDLCEKQSANFLECFNQMYSIIMWVMWM